MSKKRKQNSRRPGEKLLWWHGGQPGLQPGALLLPPLATRTSYTSPFLETSDDEDATAAAHLRERRVYITSDFDYAAFFAYAWGTPQGVPFGNGEVYRVEPLGTLDLDPDDAAKTSRAVRRCRVLYSAGVVEEMSPLEVGAAIAEHVTFSDGTPQFNWDGWQLCDRQLLATRREIREAVDQENQRLFDAENIWLAAHQRPPLDEQGPPQIDDLIQDLDWAAREMYWPTRPGRPTPLPLDE